LSSIESGFRNWEEELVSPQVLGNELKWPDETKKAWIRVFGCEPPKAKFWGTLRIETILC